METLLANNTRMKKFMIFAMSLTASTFLSISAFAGDAIACIGKVAPGARVSKLAAASPNGAQVVIDDLRVSKGDSIEKGSVIAVISGAERAQVALKKAELATVTVKTASDMRLLAQKHLIAELKGAFDQNSKILLEKDPPRREREELEYEQTALLRKISQAEEMLVVLKQNEAAILAESNAALEEAKKYYASHFVNSPISGEVIECHIRAGEAVAHEGICEIADTKEMYVDAEVYISDISKVKIGALAEVFSDALGGQKYTGKVVQISSYVRANKMFSSDPSDFSNLKVVIAKIKLDSPEKFRNLIGSQVNVRILNK